MSVEELVQDQEFVAKIENILKTGSKDELQALLQEKNITITEAEIAELLKPEDGELDEEELDNIAGGSIIGWLRNRYYANKYKAGGGGYSKGGGGNGSFGGGGGGGGR